VEAEQELIDGAGGGGEEVLGQGLPVRVLSLESKSEPPTAHKQVKNSRMPVLEAQTSTTKAVGIYDRTFYFMTKFTHQLQERPHLALPFWLRDFVEPFENTGEEIDWSDDNN
jgi:hypothetical protein